MGPGEYRQRGNSGIQISQAERVGRGREREEARVEALSPGSVLYRIFRLPLVPDNGPDLEPGTFTAEFGVFARFSTNPDVRPSVRFWVCKFFTPLFYICFVFVFSS